MKSIIKSTLSISIAGLILAGNLGSGFVSAQELPASTQVKNVEVLSPAAVQLSQPAIKIKSTSSSALNSTVSALTLDQAVKLALESSKDVKLKSATITQTEELRDRTIDLYKFQDINPSPVNSSYYAPIGPNGAVAFVPDLAAKNTLLGLVQAEVGLTVNQRMYDVVKETVAFAVRNQFDEIKGTELKIASEKALLNSMSERIRIAQVKNGIGLESNYNLDTAMKDYEKEKKNLEILQKSLDISYEKLNILMGKSADTRDVLAYEVQYSNDIGNINVAGVLGNKMSGDPYIWAQGKNKEISEASLRLYTIAGTDKTYKEREADVEVAAKNIEKVKESYEKVFRGRITQIKQLEDQIKQNQTALSKAKLTQGLVETQVAAGLATATDLLEAQTQVTALNNAIAGLVIQHEALKAIIDKPYLVPEYVA